MTDITYNTEQVKQYDISIIILQTCVGGMSLNVCRYGSTDALKSDSFRQYPAYLVQVASLVFQQASSPTRNGRSSAHLAPKFSCPTFLPIESFVN